MRFLPWVGVGLAPAQPAAGPCFSAVPAMILYDSLSSRNDASLKWMLFHELETATSEGLP